MTKKIKCPKCGSEEAEQFNYLGVLCIRCYDCKYDESEVYDIEVTEDHKAGGKGGSPYKRGGGKRSQNIGKKY